MKIAVLFDGAGLARLGLEQAGHDCTGYELNPIAHYLSTFVGSGNCVLANVKDVDLSSFDGVWASPPCQRRSRANVSNKDKNLGLFADDLLEWSLTIIDRWPNIKYLWVENVKVFKKINNDWGTTFNAAQFLLEPLQTRTRIIGGKYPHPKVYWSIDSYFRDLCPTITATEWKCGPGDKRRACKYFYGLKLSIKECAYYQGFTIPDQWWINPSQFNLTISNWKHELYRAIGNGVPPYMAKAFGTAIN